MKNVELSLFTLYRFYVGMFRSSLVKMHLLKNLDMNHFKEIPLNKIYTQCVPLFTQLKKSLAIILIIITIHSYKTL